MWLRVFLFVVVVCLSCGCASKAGVTWKEIKPYPIPEKARCPECGMYVKDYENWASQALLKDHTVVFFDDPGDMFIYYQKHSNEIVKIYIRDYYTQEWVDAKKAYYVVDARIPTPMGFGIVPFKSRENAQAFKKDYTAGDILTFEQVLERGVSME